MDNSLKKCENQYGCSTWSKKSAGFLKWDFHITFYWIKKYCVIYFRATITTSHSYRWQNYTTKHQETTNLPKRIKMHVITITLHSQCETITALLTYLLYLLTYLFPQQSLGGWRKDKASGWLIVVHGQYFDFPLVLWHYWLHNGNGMTLSGMMQYVKWLNNLHFPPLSSPVDCLCLDMPLEWMSWQMPMKFCLCNCQINGKDPQEAMLHLEPKSFQRPVHIWHEAARSQGGSSEPTVLEDVNKA